MDNRFFSDTLDGVRDFFSGIDIRYVLAGAYALLTLGFLIALLVVITNGRRVIGAKRRAERFIKRERVIDAVNLHAFGVKIKKGLRKKDKAAWDNYFSARTDFRRDAFVSCVLFPEVRQTRRLFIFDVLSFFTACFFGAAAAIQGLDSAQFVLAFAVGALLYVCFAFCIRLAARYRYKKCFEAAGRFKCLINGYVRIDEVPAPVQSAIEGREKSSKPTRAERRLLKKKSARIA